MAEYIEREAAIELLHYYTDEACSAIVADMEALPAADVAPVRHGQWIASRDEFCVCSICKYPVYVGWNQTNYCPNCGAKMGADTQEREDE